MSSLSTLQRSLIALTALHLQLGNRTEILAQHHVTEADLGRHLPEWERLQALRTTDTCLRDSTGLLRLDQFR